MAVRVAKWGNSLAVRLPKQLVTALDLKVGDEVALTPAGPNTLEVARDNAYEAAREAALARMRASKWKLPDDYKFDREEANAR
jgi:antitoxin MazE